MSLQSLLRALRCRYGLETCFLLCYSAVMAEEPRQRRPPQPPESHHVLPEPEPAHTRRSDADSASDNEREATELRSVTPGQQSARRRSRVLSPPARSKLHWYDPVSKYWRHHINITVPHDDCRDHLGKASVLRSACALLRMAPSSMLACQCLLLIIITTTDISCPHQQMNALFLATCVPPLHSPC